MSLMSTPCTEKLKIKNQEENHLTDNIFFFFHFYNLFSTFCQLQMCFPGVSCFSMLEPAEDFKVKSAGPGA